MCQIVGSGALLWSRVVLHLSLTFHIFNFSSAMAEQNSLKFNRKQDLKHSLPSYLFFRLIEKQRWPSRPLIGWDIFDFSATAVWNSTKLDRSKISTSSIDFGGKKRSKVKITMSIYKNVWKWPCEHNPGQSHKHIFIRHN